MLQGDMIAIPFGMWLFLALFDFSSIGPLFAILAFLGAFVACGTRKQSRYYVIKILAAFLLLLSPLVWRLSVVPLELFDYTAFKAPLVFFVIFFIASLILETRNHEKFKPSL
jgi:hypothetical protein